MRTIKNLPFVASSVIVTAADHGHNNSLRRAQLGFPSLEEICEITSGSKTKGLCTTYEEKECFYEEDPSTHCSKIHDRYERLTGSAMPSDCPCVTEFEAFANAFITLSNCESCERCYQGGSINEDWGWVDIFMHEERDGLTYIHNIGSMYGEGESRCMHHSQIGEAYVNIEMLGTGTGTEISRQEAHQCTRLLHSLVERSGIPECNELQIRTS